MNEVVGMSVGDIWEGRGAWERFPETLGGVFPRLVLTNRDPEMPRLLTQEWRGQGPRSFAYY